MIKRGVEPVIKTKSNSGLLWLLIICILLSIIVMLFTHGMIRIIFQGICFGLVMILSKTMITGSAEPDFMDSQSIQDLYLQNLDYFFGKELLKQKSSL